MKGYAIINVFVRKASNRMITWNELSEAYFQMRMPN